ncbi:MAG: DUF4339 domain-containing protein [Verrucomicrobiota bacterium]
MDSTDTEEIYILRGEEKLGPYDVYQIATFWQKSDFLEEDFIWKDGMDEWASIQDFLDTNAEVLEMLLFEESEQALEREDFEISEADHAGAYASADIGYGNYFVESLQRIEINLGDLQSQVNSVQELIELLRYDLATAFQQNSLSPDSEKA